MASANAATALASDTSFELQAGGALIVRPRYEGSKDYELRGAPIVAPAGGTGNGVVQFKAVDDLRFRVINLGGFEAGPLAGYRFGREDDDGERLRGLGDVDGGVVVGGYAAYAFGILKPFVSYHHQVTGDDAGGIVRFGTEVKVPVVAGWQMTLVGGATWADDDYMQSFFGVTALQSAASLAGVAQFDTDAGIKDAFIGASAEVPLSDRLSLKLGARYTHLLGDAASSPLTETDSQWSGTAGLTWRFTLPR